MSGEAAPGTAGYARAVGATVQAARKRLELTQEELAERIGRTPEGVSNIERGRNLPSLDTLVELARALEVPLAEFFGPALWREEISPDRARRLAELRELARSLDDERLALAVELVQVLARRSAP